VANPLALAYLQHALDIGREGWKAIDGVLDLAGRNSVLHGKRKDVDQFFASVAHHVSAQDLIGFLVDDDF